MLSTERLKKLDKILGSNADRWLKRNLVKRERRPVSAKRVAGKKESVIVNPFFGYAFSTDEVNDRTTARDAMYPKWAVDVLVGVSRMPWYGRPDGPSLSIKKMVEMLAKLENISSRRVQMYLGLGEDQSQRYASALQIVVPRLMACRPAWLVKRMDNSAKQTDGLKIIHAHWEDDLEPPPPDVLEALQHAMATLPGHEQYDEEYQAELDHDLRAVDLVASYEPPAPIPNPEHPKKAQVMALLSEGKSIREIVRQTGVSNTTIQKWKKLKTT
ncbi:MULTISPECIES: helix-turn-helix domain-containing protein [Pseudomonas]|uniref:helix-turn-helix domain-containing protein n=1 Tax=Pseudomonas nitroreducens TaxID=46680 RepID=UPI001E38D359|nr:MULTISPECIES: helix-turn-helix domain-containing protein [Pseudomonas]MCE4069658.1 helix-turn-helix domain containing protein [Pseudomonas nitritireducens]MCE4079179.1 helix-turn-helix domain containing protein [Pseudomonas nitroreducens]